MFKKRSRLLAFSAAFGAAALILWFTSANFVEYSAFLRRLGLWVSSVLSGALSILPFPLSEWVIIGAPVAVIVAVVMAFRRFGFKRGWTKALVRLVFAVTLAAFIFMLTFGVQYTAPPLGESLGLYVGLYSADQLREVTDYFLRQANYYAALAPRNAEGVCEFGSFEDISRAAMESYRGLAEGGEGYDYSVFSTPRRAAPKRSVILGVAMSYVGTAGYFFPWTGEAVVSGDYVDVQFPFCIAHEAAHAHGIAAENEANFAAFLACSASADTRLLYSGYFNAYIYAMNALYAASPEDFYENALGRSELLQRDLDGLSAHLAKYESPVRDAGSAINDSYIKATGQAEGLKTYGMVVDLLLADYFRGK